MSSHGNGNSREFNQSGPQAIEALVVGLLKEGFDRNFSNLLGEGKRLVKIQLLGFAENVIHGFRKLFILNYALIALSVLMTVSLFFAGVCLVSEFKSKEIIFSSSVFVVSFMLFWFLVRQKTWMVVSGLEKHIEEVLNPEPIDETGQIDPEMIAQIVEKAVERKMQEYTNVHPIRSNKKR